MRAGSTVICSRGACAKSACRVTCCRSTRPPISSAASAASSSPADRAASPKQDSPRVHPSILSMGVPILGICYGHQLLAATMPGGVVKPSYSREYGLAKLQLGARMPAASVNGLFAGFPQYSRVWVSHGDSVETLPDGFEVLGVDRRLRGGGHGERRRCGSTACSFIRRSPTASTASGCSRISCAASAAAASHWKPSSAETIEAIKADIRAQRRPDRRSVLFFVSGGVDSTVAYKLCADALGQDRVHGVYVDTGFMRKNESAEVMAALREGRLQERPAARRVGGISRRGRRRRRIRRSSASESACRFSRSRTTCSSICRRASGCSGRARFIRTRSSRAARASPRSSRRTTTACPSCCGGSRRGRSSSRSSQFYKDEVREIGRALGLPARLIDKQPFPGPGLAVRFLCTDEPAAWSENAKLSEVAATFKLRRACCRCAASACRATSARTRTRRCSPATTTSTSIAELSPGDHQLAARRESRGVLGRRERLDRRVPASSRRRRRAKGSTCCARPTRACATSSPSTTRRTASGSARS